MSFLDIHIQAE